MAENALACRIDRTAAAERIIEEMASRQGQRFGPYFEWSLATEIFLQRFNAVWARRPQAASIEWLEELAVAFVDQSRIPGASGEIDTTNGWPPPVG